MRRLGHEMRLAPLAVKAVNKARSLFDWPFTVSGGRVAHRTGGEVACVVNGTADAFASQRGYESVHAIWKANPNIPGAPDSPGAPVSTVIKSTSIQ